jgi:hypothetical protein
VDVEWNSSSVAFNGALSVGFQFATSNDSRDTSRLFAHLSSRTRRLIHYSWVSSQVRSHSLTLTLTLTLSFSHSFILSHYSINMNKVNTSYLYMRNDVGEGVDIRCWVRRQWNSYTNCVKNHTHIQLWCVICALPPSVLFSFALSAKNPPNLNLMCFVFADFFCRQLYQLPMQLESTHVVNQLHFRAWLLKVWLPFS